MDKSNSKIEEEYRTYKKQVNLQENDYAEHIVSKISEIAQKHSAMKPFMDIAEPSKFKHGSIPSSEEYDALQKIIHITAQLVVDYYILARLSVDCSQYLDDMLDMVKYISTQVEKAE